MRTPVYIANWKMFHSLETADAWLNWWFTHPLIDPPGNCATIVCPPSPLLYPMFSELQRWRHDELRLGGQALHHSFKGAFTGDVSGVALWSVGAQAVLVGHSERRHQHKETDDQIAEMMRQAYLCGLMPMLCIGETQDERDSGDTVSVLVRQLSTALASIDATTFAHRQGDPDLPTLVIAYEPIWAIGTGRSATAPLAQEALAVIEHWLIEKYGEVEVGKMSLVYGGSVTADNVATFTALPECDGVLVGGASLDPGQFQGSSSRDDGAGDWGDGRASGEFDRDGREALAWISSSDESERP